MGARSWCQTGTLEQGWFFKITASTNCQWTVVTNNVFLSECFLMRHLLWWKRSWNYHESLIFDKILNLEMPECSKTYKPQHLNPSCRGVTPPTAVTQNSQHPSTFSFYQLLYLTAGVFTIRDAPIQIFGLWSTEVFIPVQPFPSLYSTPFFFFRSTWLAVIFQIPPWQLPCLNQSELTSFWLICTFCDWFSSLGIIWCSVPSLPEQIKL